MIDLYFLNQFIKVAECQNLSHAAELLNITQPALSRNIKKLEEELEVELFRRSKNKIELTESGLYTVKKAKTLLENAEQMKEDVKKYYESLHTISIGFCSPFIQTDGLISNLNQKFSGQKITTEVKNEKQLLKGLVDGKYDIIIYSRKIDEKDFYSKSFLKECLYAMIDKKDVLSLNKALVLENLKGKTLMLMPRDGYWNDMLCSYFAGSHLLRQKDINDYNEIISNSSIITFITSTVLSKINLPAGRIALPLDDECCSIEYCYICLEKNKNKFSDCF